MAWAKTVERLHEMGIYTGADLLDISEVTLIDRFGRLGFDLYRKVRAFITHRSSPIAFVSPLARKKPTERSYK